MAGAMNKLGHKKNGVRDQLFLILESIDLWHQLIKNAHFGN